MRDAGCITYLVIHIIHYFAQKSMVILKKIMQNKKEADPDGAEGWDRKKKTGNV